MVVHKRVPLRQSFASSCFKKITHTNGNAKKEVSVFMLLEFIFSKFW